MQQLCIFVIHTHVSRFFSTNASRNQRKSFFATLIAGALIVAFPIKAMAGNPAYSSDPFNSPPTDNVDLPYTPAEANSDFSLPYSDALGSGGQSWRGILSGTMQTTAPCVTNEQALQAGGSANTTGKIAIYTSASKVAEALSVSGSAGYKGVAKVEVSASFSSKSSKSSNSIFAVATVHTNMGMVNLGRQSLLPEIKELASQLNTVPEAMRFVSRCGDSYVRGFTQGASWIAVLRIKSTSSKSAEEIAASISGSYAGLSASAKFSTNTSSLSSSSSTTLTEHCHGPLYCGESSVTGQAHTDPGTCATAACELSTFTSNFNYMMRGGLASSCASTSSTASSTPAGLAITSPDAAKCVVSVHYAPISDLLSSKIPVKASSRDELSSMDEDLVDAPKAPYITVSGGKATRNLPTQNGQVTVVVRPDKLGGQPDSFRIKAINSRTRVAAGTCSADFSVSETSHCIVSGLTNGQTYAFTARAVNAAGTSGPSNRATSTPNELAVNPDNDPVFDKSVKHSALVNRASSRKIARAMQSVMSPSELVRAAAYGAFGVQRNLSNWATEFESVASAEEENEAFNQTCGAPVTSKYCADGTNARITIQNQIGVSQSDQLTNHWSDNVRNLNRQALACGREYMAINPACSERMTACWVSSLDVTSYTNEECQPDAFATNSLLHIANPFLISELLHGNDELSLDGLQEALDALGISVSTGSPVLAQSVSAGGAHTCALMQDEMVRCWGKNSYGQIGVGTTSSTSGVQKVNLGDVRQVAAGIDYTCALTMKGLVYCWGSNSYGQIGDATTTNRPSPTAVSGLQGVTQIAVGGGHSCALLSSGQVRCWGKNDYSQASGSTSITSNLQLPTVVPGISAKSISAGGFHTCAVLTTGVSKCWGQGTNYQLGNTANSTRYGPVAVKGSSNDTSIHLGGSNSCSKSNGAVRCWGRNNNGQTGNGTISNSTTSPTNINGDYLQLSLGLGQTTCGITSDLKTYCWGTNTKGQMGDGTLTNGSAPTLVQQLAGSAVSVSVGGYVDSTDAHTCAVLSSGVVQCWGSNNSGQLGIGIGDSLAPRTVTFSA